MEISATDVKNLRDMTGAGMMEAKKALTEANGDVEKATALLRERGASIAASKSDRVAANGVIASYVHNSRVGVIVEVMVETDFVARDEKFVMFADQIAMHIAGMSPKYVSADQVPAGENAKDVALLEQPFVLDPSKTVGDFVNEHVAIFKENIQIGHFARLELGAPTHIC